MSLSKFRAVRLSDKLEAHEKDLKDEIALMAEQVAIKKAVTRARKD